MSSKPVKIRQTSDKNFYGDAVELEIECDGRFSAQHVAVICDCGVDREVKRIESSTGEIEPYGLKHVYLLHLETCLNCGYED